MNRHPGGMEHTKQMISLSGLLPPAKILDMGAGLGESAALLRSLGYEALGIDLNAEPQQPFILKGDFLSSPFSDESFDGILSQCAFYASGHPLDAFKTAYTLLKPDGILMISDVCPRDTSLQTLAEISGFTVLHFEDQTSAWKEYYIEAIWRGTAECFPCSQKMNYEMLICQK